MAVSRAGSFAGSVGRVFELSLGQMLWSRRTVFMAIIVTAPVILAAAARTALAGGVTPLTIDGSGVGSAALFGMLVWVVYLAFVVPVLGVFYGTSLVADEVEDRTITYLFTRPVRRGAVLLGKYLAYLVCTALVVLPSVMLVYFILVPLGEMAASFGWLVTDMGLLTLGLAAYGALFAAIGAALRRPVLAGLMFAFGWEPLALLMPGYLNRVTIAYYLHALVPHATPPEEVGLLMQGVFTEPPGPATSVATLLVVAVVSLTAGVRVIESREYVLDQ